MSEASVDPVLLSPRPPCSAADACAIANRFGVTATDAHDLGSERDRTFLLLAGDASPVGVLKVSNAAESVDTLDMEAEVVEHIARVDRDLPVARPMREPGTGATRVAWIHDGLQHWARLYPVIPGHGRHDPRTLSDAALTAWGTTAARLTRAMRGYAHPSAIRTIPWDVQHAALCRPMLTAIGDAAARTTVTRVLDRFDTEVAPRWPSLRAQVLHGDLTIDNALIDDDGLVTGIVDFGDMSHTTLLADLASVLDSLATGRDGDEMFRVARLTLDGYQRIVPLEPDELDLIGDVWATRTAVGIAIGSWRGRQGLEDPAFAERYHATALAMLDHMLTIGWDGVRRALAAPHDGHDDGTFDLVERRGRVFGPAVETLTYDEPIHMASAHSVWMTDTAGRRYLDAYNNVPCVGHAHPRVAEAIARQGRVLNTNLRYLHGSAVELAERLVDTLPDSLDTVFFVNSGSEANDLAWRLATGFTGHTGGLCTLHAYHGISHAIAPMSPEVLPDALLPAHIERWSPTDTYRNLHTDASSFAEALARLGRRGIAPAMAILDGVLQSDGVYDLDPALVQQWVRLTHDAGGLWVADEVQGGHGRTGEAMWSFERFGIEPDFVTLGKPMGNGHPVAAVITRRDIAERMAEHTVFFSTFGGNQVSVAAAHAVLDVIADERVLPRVVAAGNALRTSISEAVEPYDCVGDVRGVGLANAIELVTDRTSQRPDAAMAAAVRNGLRRHGVLVGTTGRDANILKVRPPLAFTADHAPVFAAALEATMQDLCR
ncbi:MAG: aminotransferase class III-fold pyridoxal phosphate-dependent enzyme [Ilumatobacteraceae bacterium]